MLNDIGTFLTLDSPTSKNPLTLDFESLLMFSMS